MARKSKDFRNLLHQEKDKKQDQESYLRFKQSMMESGLGDQVRTIIDSPEGVERMSDVLEDFIDPYLVVARNHEQRLNLFNIAVLAWNCALLEEEKRQAMIEDTIKELCNNKPNSQLARDTKQILNELIERKLTLFPDINRVIINFKLDKNLHLSVASSLPKSPQPID